MIIQLRIVEDLLWNCDKNLMAWNDFGFRCVPKRFATFKQIYRNIAIFYENFESPDSPRFGFWENIVRSPMISNLLWMKSAFYSRKTASTETGDVTDNWERPPLRNLLLGDILFVSLIPDIRIMVNPVKRSLEAKVSNKNEVTETNVNDNIERTNFEAMITDY